MATIKNRLYKFEGNGWNIHIWIFQQLKLIPRPIWNFYIKSNMWETFRNLERILNKLQKNHDHDHVKTCNLDSFTCSCSTIMEGQKWQWIFELLGHKQIIGVSTFLKLKWTYSVDKFNLYTLIQLKITNIQLLF